MENFDEHIDALIARHLAGEATPAEEAALQAWAAEASANRRYLADLQALWQKTPAMRPAPARKVDTEAALQRVKTRMQAAGPRMVRLSVVWRAAAAVAVTLVAAYFLWLRNFPAPDAVLVSTDIALTDTLADGSIVSLGPRSGLTLAAGFNTRERRLRLQGKATFEVQTDPTQPFIVEMQDLEVQVVGTVFQVDNASDPTQVHISVTEGKVRVSGRGNSLLLTAGEQAMFNLQTGSLERIQPQGRVLRFDATPLRDVAQQIERAYSVQIILRNSALDNCLLTARYNNLPVERVLGLVAESFNIRLEKTADGYMLDGTGCGE